MKKGQRAFWTYTTVGLVFALVISIPLRFWVEPTWIHPNPDYTEYKAWMKMHGDDYEQRQFEEAVAGLRPVEDISDSALRELATGITNLSVESKANGLERASAMTHLLSSRKIYADFISCNESGRCVFIGPLVVMNDPSRLGLLLEHNAQAIQSGLPTMPLHIQRLANAMTLPRALPRPAWLVLAEPLGFSWLFALGFMLAGTFYYSPEDKASLYTRPLRTFPHSLLAVCFFIVMLPGYAFFALLSFLISDLGQIRFRKRVFTDQYERVLADLEQMRERAGARNDKATLGRIGKLEKRVRVAQGKRELDDLEAVCASLSEYEDGLAEVDKLLKV